jgi:hypothetical protein
MTNDQTPLEPNEREYGPFEIYEKFLELFHDLAGAGIIADSGRVRLRISTGEHHDVVWTCAEDWQ